MYWQTAEFNEDITKYNYIQLADWIERCRLVVNWNEYIRLEKTREEYLADLDGFCKEWEAHYQWHEETYKRNSVYKSNKFRKALVYLQFRKRVSFIVDYGKTKETQSISAYEKQTNRLYMKKQVEENFQKVWHTHYELVEDIFVPDEEKPVELLEVDAETGKPVAMNPQVAPDKDTTVNVATFEADADGEYYVASVSGGIRIYKITVGEVEAKQDSVPKTGVVSTAAICGVIALAGAGVAVVTGKKKEN